MVTTIMVKTIFNGKLYKYLVFKINTSKEKEM